MVSIFNPLKKDSMIPHNIFQLDNGLKVIHLHDENTPMTVVNTLYDVGARDEDPNRTGFAHLFEHLMFGGSVNIPDFDKPLQRAGGESNAFTSNDITNYYDVIPSENLETALWLESDRMLSLAFTDKSLEVQRQVVIEEFKQRYLNQPYGDVWLELRPMVYTHHPYQWATIGKNIQHIEDATMEEVKSFFKKHYSPQNAIVVVAGNNTLEEVKELVEKYYKDIPKGEFYKRDLPHEPVQTALRIKDLEREVPADAFYWAFRMPHRLHPDYYTADLVSDILGRGSSSRLYDAMLREKTLCAELNAYIMGSKDDGMLVVSGKLSEGVDFETLETEMWKVLNTFKQETIASYELEKVKNKWKTTKVFGDVTLLNKAMNMAYYEWLGDIGLMEKELSDYEKITSEDIKRFAETTLVEEQLSILRIHKK